MPYDTSALSAIVLLVLAFAFLNGFHDAANSIATVVSTRVLSPRKAVAWAALFNFLAAFVLGTHVAETVGRGMIDLSAVTGEVITAGLVGAIAWNLFTWYHGIPVSSSHALIGGYAGAAVAKAGWGAIVASGWTSTLAFILLAPLLGIVLGLALMSLASWAFRRWDRVRLDGLFGRLQLVSAALYSLGHGGNDAQKTMGTRITKLEPFGGFCAETAGALTLFGATLSGVPVSTTHTITGAIVGVGATRRVSAVKWGVAGRIVWAWVLTIPIAAAIAAASHLVLRVLP
jgi:PiT family inorganic phosphate transporter